MNDPSPSASLAALTALTALLAAEPRAQTGIVNGDFEDPAPFAGWTLEYATYQGSAFSPFGPGLPVGAPAPQIVPSFSGYPLTVAIGAYEGTHMAQINDLGGQNHVTRMSQTFTLTQDDRNSGLLALQWGTLLEEPGHPNEPGMSVVIRHNGTEIQSFSATTTIASSSWNQVQVSTGAAVYYRHTQLATPLPANAIVGDAVTVEITAWDCGHGGHGGCAFLDDVRFVDCVETPADLVAWWRTGSLLDWTNNHHQGSWNWISTFPWSGSGGYVGEGQVFSPLRSATVGDAADLDFVAGASFTIEMWLRPSAGAFRPLVVKTGSVAGNQTGYACYLEAGKPTLMLAGGGQITAASANVGVPADVWSHVAVIVDRGASPRVTFVIDGSVVTSTSTPPLLGDVGNDAPLLLGKFPAGFQTIVNGAVQSVTGGYVGITDEIAIYRRALGADEIQHIVTAGTRGRCPPSSIDAMVGLAHDPWWVQAANHAAIGAGGEFVAVQQLPFGIRMHGELFDTVAASANGFLYLLHAGGPGGGSAAGYGDPATMLTNLLFDAPRIAPYWCDLDLSPTSGSLRYDGSQPDRVVFTWANATEAGVAGERSVQCHLHRDGDIVFSYSPNFVSGPGTVLVGFSPGGGSWDPGAVDLGSQPTAVGDTTYEMFTGGVFDLAGRYVRFRPTTGGYEVLSDDLDASGHTSYGVGCGGSVASFYEAFAAGGLDLSHATIGMVDSAAGIVVHAGNETLVPPSTPGLALTDDSQVTLALPVPLWFGGLLVDEVVVCSNGFVWLAPNGSNDYTPSGAELVAGSPRLAPCWGDLVPDGATNVNNVHAEFVGGSLRVTWWNCAVYGAAGRVTAQLVLDCVAQRVHYVYGACDPQKPVVVGWSPGSGSADPGSVDLTGAMPFTLGLVDVGALSLVGAGTPTPGSTLTFTTSNIPVGTGATLHFLNFGASTIFDLGLLGAPGCSLLVDLPPADMAWTPGTPVAARVLLLPLDPTIAGLGFYSQSVAFVPVANALGMLTSNGVVTSIAPFL